MDESRSRMLYDADVIKLAAMKISRSRMLWELEVGMMDESPSRMLLGTRRYQVGSDEGRSIGDALGSRKFHLAHVDAPAVRSPNGISGDAARAPEGIVAKEVQMAL